MTKVVLSDALPNARGYNDPLTEDEVETIVSLKRDEGMTVGQIAEQVGRSTATIIRYLSRNGLSTRTPRRKGPPLSEVQFVLIHGMKQDGVLTAEISVKTGLSLEEINRAYASPGYDYYINHR